jgi:hypothetical protein
VTNLSAIRSGPPDNELGVAVPLRLEIGRTGDLVFGAVDFIAFSTGFLFTFTIRRRVFPMEGWQWRRSSDADGISPDALRLGIEFSDGGTSTVSFDERGRIQNTARVLQLVGPIALAAGGGDMTWQMWVAQLPRWGRLTLFCAWEAESVAELRNGVEVQPLLDAAAASDALWPGQPPLEPGF